MRGCVEGKCGGDVCRGCVRGCVEGMCVGDV